MDPNILGAAAAALVVGGIVAFKIAVSAGARRKRLENVRRVIQALGLVERPSRGLLDRLKCNPVAEGSVRGFALGFYHHSHSGGRHAAHRYFTSVEIRGTGHGDLTFRLVPTDRKAMVQRRGKLALNVNAIFGLFGEDLLTGDAAFDEAWQISCSTPEKLVGLFDADVRARILASGAGGAGTTDLDAQRLCYYEIGPFQGAADAARLAGMGEALTLLAGRLWPGASNR